MDQNSRPQSSYDTSNCGYTHHLIDKPMRSYRDVLTQTYNIQSTDNGDTREVATETDSRRHQPHRIDKRDDENLETGNRCGNGHRKTFSNSSSSDLRRDLEFGNTGNDGFGYGDDRRGHRSTTSFNSADISNRSESRGSSGNAREEASIGMLTLPTISERICIRWASQKGWEPYIEGMNKISEPTSSWLLTSMKNYYIDLRILHPWHWQQNQQEQEMQLRRIQALNDYHKALASGYGKSKNGMGRIWDEGNLFVGNGGPFNRNSPLSIGDQPLNLPENSVITVPSNSNPIIMGTSIESVSAGHYVLSTTKVVHPMVSTEPSSVSSQTVHVTWSEWINGEPTALDIGMGYPLMLSWQATLGTYTTRLEYEGLTTFRMIGQRMNPVMHAVGAYQEGWKVVPVASMPLSSKVSLSTSSRSFIERYRTVRDKEIHSSRKDTTHCSRNMDRNMPRHRCGESCRQVNNDTTEIRSTSASRVRSRPTSRLSSDAMSRQNTDRVKYLPKSKNILNQARTCIVLRYEDPSYQARGMIVRVGDHCQGILRLGDYITIERWQWYPGAAESAASLNTLARAEADARKRKCREGLSSGNAGDYEGETRQKPCNAQKSHKDGVIIISDDSDEAAHVPMSASTTRSTPTLVGSEAPVPKLTPSHTPSPMPASIAAITDSGAGWKREVRIGQGYLPCSIAFGVSTPRIREGTSVNFMDMIWEVVEVFNW